MDSRISEHGGAWSVGGMKFSSPQEAEIYLKKRDSSGLGGLWRSLRATPWHVQCVVALGVLYVVSTVITATGPARGVASQAPGTATTASDPARDLMGKSERVALLLNMNGQLCATVTGIEYLYGQKFNVTCIRYRDGTGSATYELDLKNGQAK